MVRAAGVPARVVTGYQGGELNPVDQIITVRQSDAHAWAEVFLKGRGWVRVDPTAAAVPGRLQSGLARALPAGEALALMMRPQLEWLRTVRFRWDALAHKWNVWVLGYNPERQRDLMLLLGIRDADWRSLTATLFTILGVMTLVLLAWSLRQLVRPDQCRGPGARSAASSRRAASSACRTRGRAITRCVRRARCPARGALSCASPGCISACATAPRRARPR